MPGAGKGSVAVPRGFSARNIERPRWSVDAGSVRTRSVIRSARAAWVIQVLAPLTRQTPPSSAARVRSDPRSEPASGSVKTAVGMISPDAMRGR